jgi:hypothetical protein
VRIEPFKVFSEAFDRNQQPTGKLVRLTLNFILPTAPVPSPTRKVILARELPAVKLLRPISWAMIATDASAFISAWN